MCDRTKSRRYTSTTPKRMAMALASGVVAAVPSSVTSPSPSQHSSESFQVRAACATYASPSTSSSVAPAWELLSISGRGLRKRANFLGQSFGKQRRRIRVRVDAAGEEGGEEPREAVNERWSLEELDQQLKVFESRETSAPRQIPSGQRNPVTENLLKLQWPELTTGFFAFAGIGLVLLTLVNNVLYKIFLDHGINRKEPLQTSVPVTARYRVTTRQEDTDAREERDASDAQKKALAAQSRDAPIPFESP